MSRLFVSIALVASALATAAPPAAATALIVCDTGCPYSSIQTAINAASPGDTVVVRPGTYAETLLIDEEVTVCSTTATGVSCNANAANTILDTNAIYPVFITADNVVFQGFTIDNGDYTGVDVGAAWVDPSAIVVYGSDDVTIADNVIKNVASIPLPHESRRYTIGINIGTDNVVPVPARADNVEVLRNTMSDFPPAQGAGSACTDCRVYGILNWGRGAGFLAEENDIRLGAALPRATGIKFTNNANTEILDNFIRMPSSAPGSAPDVVGIDGGVTNAALIEDNNIAVTLTSSPGGLYGIWGIFTNTEFRGNLVQLAQHGIGLRSSIVGGNLVVGNEFRNSNQGVLNFADNTDILDNTFTGMATGAIVLDHVDAPGGPYSASQNVAIHGNTFRNSASNLLISDTVAGTFFDAQRNDWGVYSADLIRETIHDQEGTNDVDISCFIDEDGVTEVCPLASFTVGVSGTTWPRTVTLTDTSTYPGSSMDAREWTLPGGATSTDAVVTLSLGPGGYSFQLEVTDGEGFTDTATQALTLSNAAPVFALGGPHAATEGVAFSLALAATDADGDTLAYSLLSGPTGASISGSTLSWTPGFASAGTHAFSVSVTDGDSTVSDSSSIVVADVPVGAAIANIADLSILELGSGSRSVVATSPSGSPISLSVSGGHPAAVFTDNGDGTGSFTITAPVGSAGTYPVTVSALSEGITTTKSFTLSIAQNAALVLTRTTPAVIQSSPGSTVTITGTLTNAGTGGDTFTLVATNNKGWSVSVPGSITLPSGGSATVNVAVVVPAGGAVSFTNLVACSTASPTVCRSFSTRIEIPVIATLTMGTTFGVLDEIRGSVSVKYLNGAAVPGASVSVVESSDEDLLLFETMVQGTTDATGVYEFELTDARAHFLGRHSVTVTARLGDIHDVEYGHYFVGL